VGILIGGQLVNSRTGHYAIQNMTENWIHIQNGRFVNAILKMQFVK